MKNIVRRNVLIVGAVLAAAMMAAPAFAQGMGHGMGQGMGQGMGRGGGMVMSECTAEIKKHCADVPHGSGGVPACLEKHKTELTDACKKALDQNGMGQGMGRGRN